ncbi:MAG: hypothetical protein R6V55_06990 [Desulfovermiculus sp.]
MTGLKKNIDFLYDALQSEHCKGLRDLPPEELAEEIERMLSKSPEIAKTRIKQGLRNLCG